MKKLVPLLFIVLSSCATTTQFAKNVSTWDGKTESDLVQAWGPPSSVYPMQDGKKILTYYRSGDTHYNALSGTTSADNCKVDFTLNSAATITNTRFEGTKCKSEPDWRLEDAKKQQEQRRRDYGQDVD